MFYPHSTLGQVYTRLDFFENSLYGKSNRNPGLKYFPNFRLGKGLE